MVNVRTEIHVLPTGYSGEFLVGVCRPDPISESKNVMNSQCQCAMSDDMLTISLVTKRTGVPRQVFVCKSLVRGRSENSDHIIGKG